MQSACGVQFIQRWKGWRLEGSDDGGDCDGKDCVDRGPRDSKEEAEEGPSGDANHGGEKREPESEEEEPESKEEM